MIYVFEILGNVSQPAFISGGFYDNIEVTFICMLLFMSVFVFIRQIRVATLGGVRFFRNVRCVVLATGMGV